MMLVEDLPEFQATAGLSDLTPVRIAIHRPARLHMALAGHPLVSNYYSYRLGLARRQARIAVTILLARDTRKNLNRSSLKKAGPLRTQFNQHGIF